jgi:hypothetical protein
MYADQKCIYIFFTTLNLIIDQGKSYTSYNYKYHFQIQINHGKAKHTATLLRNLKRTHWTIGPFYCSCISETYNHHWSHTATILPLFSAYGKWQSDFFRKHVVSTYFTSCPIGCFIIVASPPRRGHANKVVAPTTICTSIYPMQNQYYKSDETAHQRQQSSISMIA